MKRFVTTGILLALSLALLSWSVSTAWPRPVQAMTVETTGHELRQEDGAYENGWNVQDRGPSRFLTFYLRYKPLLGEPVSGSDGRCQSFRFGRICVNLGNPPDWQVELTNSGLEDLQLEGYTPKPGASPHPAVRDWLVSQMDVGTDVTRVVGRTLSDPLCDKQSHACRQWSDKQLFLFQEEALTAAEVQRAPLGLWLAHPQARVAPATRPQFTPSRASICALVGGVMLSLVALATLRRPTSTGAPMPV